MKRHSLCAIPVCLIFAACAGAPVRPEAPPFGVRAVAVAGVSGAGKQGAAIAAAFSRRLEEEGIRSISLEKTDDVLAGAAPSLARKPDSRLLEEIRRATDAEAVALLGLDPARRWISVTVLDTRSGDVLLSAKKYPSGDKFLSVAEAADAAAEPLSAFARAQETPRTKEEDGSEAGETALGIGVNVLGGQLDYQPSPATRAELRYQSGKDGSGGAQVAANVVGLRGYRLFWERGATRPYFGLEASYVGIRASAQTGSGGSGGAFIGIERRLCSRLWIGIDAGPYLLFLRDKSAGVSQTSLEFVGNTSLIFYVF